MNIITNVLSLEVTQFCNLDCKHCLQGDNYPVFMNETIIRNIFKEVKIVKTLLLTGGEVFLAYETIKKIFAIAKQMGVFLISCEIITNGCIYDQRIYDLLDEMFGENYSVSISDDDFHLKSIQRVYSNDKKEQFAYDSFLFPINLTDVWQNWKKHMENPHFSSFKGLGDRLICVGRAKHIDYLPTYEYFVMGYFYQFYKDYLLVGPVLFVDANGFVGDCNGEIAFRFKEALGNVYEDSISSCVLYGGIREYSKTIKDFFSFCQNRMHAYYKGNGPFYRIEDEKMKLVPRPKELSPSEEMQRFQDFFKNCDSKESLFKLALAYDFSKYPYDLSVIDHQHEC